MNAEDILGIARLTLWIGAAATVAVVPVAVLVADAADAEAQGPRSERVDRSEPGHEGEVPARRRADEEQQASPWPSDDEVTQARYEGQEEREPVRPRSVVPRHVSDPPRPVILSAHG